MRRLLSIVIFLTSSLVANAQVISVDKTRDGIRTVATEETICRSMTDKMVLAVSLCAFVNEEKHDTIYTIRTHITSSSPLEVTEKSPMLIRLMDDTVMELSALVGDKEMVRDVIVVNNYVTHTSDISPLFKATPEQITAISKIGVKKVRIDVSPKMYDKEFKKDKIGSTIRMKWAALKATLKQKRASGDSFRDGF